MTITCAGGDGPKTPARRAQSAAVVALVAALIAWSFYRGATKPNRVLALPGQCLGLAFTKDGRRLAVGLSRGTLAFDTATWREVPASRTPIALATALDPAFDPDHARRAVASHPADPPAVSVLDVRTGRRLRFKRIESRLGGAVIESVALSRRWLAAAYGTAQQTEVYLWDVGR